MSREVDERVVAMYFDNKNFEKNIHTTIDSLDELKKSVNIEKSIKGFDTLKKATENLKIDDITRKVKNLQGVFQGLGNVVSRAFNIGTGPLRTLQNLFSTFEGYVTKFIGFDIAGKLVNGLENAFRQLTVAPLATGFNEYELKMDSIKTIMSGTGESLDVVNNKIQELNHYADQTIYSFSDMTSNIGKFTNNAVSLDDATSAIKGLANATADAGQGAQQASMAMYNASQAMGVGTMKMIDWKSFENANIATQRMKNTFMEAAVAHGRLVKELDKDSNTMKYYLVDEKTGKKVKAPKDQKGKYFEVNVENFRETLNKDWLDKDTMLDTFKIFSGDLKTIADFRREGFTEALGFKDEDIQKLIEIGENAMKAATEVRTFTKMYDALKEAAQSGWGETFEYLFGDMEEGTSLWTSLNDKISDMLNRSAEARNDAFAEWRGMFKDWKGEWHQSKDVWVWDVKYDNAGRVISKTRKQIASARQDGRKVLIESFMELLDLLREIGGAITGAWEGVFGKFDSKKLWSITNGFKDLVDRMKAWLGTAKDSESRLSKLRKGLTGVFSILKFVINIVKTGANLIGRLVRPIADVALDLFAKFGDYFQDLGKMNLGDALKKIGEGFSTLWNKVSHLSWDEIKTKFVAAWESIKTTVRTWAEENGLSDTIATLSDWKNKVTTWFTEIKTQLSTKWSEFTGWLEESGVAGFFRDAWGWITSQFTAEKKYDDRGFELNTEAPVVTWLKNIWESIESFWNGTILGTAKPIWQGIRTFGESTWAWIVSQFTAEKKYDDRGFELNTEAPIVTWLKGIWEGIETFWNDTILGTAEPVWEGIRAFGESTWGWIVSQFTAPTAYDDRGFKLNTEAPVVTWLKNIWEDISGFWNTTILGTARPIWESIRSFGENTWGWIVSQFTAKKQYDDRGFELNQQQDAPVVAWLKSIWDSIREIWNNIVGWEGWSAIGLFFTDTFAWIGDLTSGKSSASAGAAQETVETVAKLASATNEAGNEATQDGNPEQNATILERIMGALGGFWDKIQGFIGQITGSKAAMTAFETFRKVMEIVSTVIIKIVDMVHGAVVNGDWVGMWPILVGGIGTLITSLATLKWRSVIAKGMAETEGVGEMVMRIAIGMLLVAASAALLSTIDEKELQKATNALGGMAVIIGVVGAVLNLTKKETNKVQDKPVTALERFGNNVIKWVGTMGTIFIALKALPEVINAMKDSGVTGSDVYGIMTSLATLISSVGLVTAVVAKIGGNKSTMIQGMAYAAVGIIAAIGLLFTGLLAVFGSTGAINDMLGSKDDVVHALQTAGEIGMELTAAIGQIVTGFSMGANRTKNATAKEDMEWLAEMTAEFTPDRMIQLGRMMDAITELTNAIPSTFQMDRVRKFGDEMPKLGQALAKFSLGFELAFKEDGILVGDASGQFEKAIKQVEYVQKLADSMREFQSFFRFGYDRSAMGFTDDTFIDVNEEDFSALGSLYARAAVALATAINKGLSEEGIEGMQLKFDATPIVDSIVVALGYGETAIASAVHAMVQAGIDLSGNPQKQSKYNTDVIQKLLSGEYGSLEDMFGGGAEGLFGNFSADSIFGEGGLQGVISSAIGDLNTEELGTTLSTQLGGLSEEFKGMFTIEDLQTQLGNFIPTDTEGNVDMDATLAKFQEQMGTISEQLSESGIEVTIKPVFDMTDLQAGIETMNEYFRQNPIYAGMGDSIPQVTINIDNNATIQAINEARASVYGLSERLGAECQLNREAINAMSGHIDNIAGAVRNMQIYLDSGVIAGAVDRILGYNFFLAGRTGN